MAVALDGGSKKFLNNGNCDHDLDPEMGVRFFRVITELQQTMQEQNVCNRMGIYWRTFTPYIRFTTLMATSAKVNSNAADYSIWTPSVPGKELHQNAELS